MSFYIIYCGFILPDVSNSLLYFGTKLILTYRWQRIKTSHKDFYGNMFLIPFFKCQHIVPKFECKVDHIAQQWQK